MLLLGIDIGTSSIKVSVVDAQTQERIVSVSYPETETEIISKQPGWAEQSPLNWWEHTQQAILKANATKKYNPTDIAAIGISYQMHGLVVVDKDNNEVHREYVDAKSGKFAKTFDFSNLSDGKYTIQVLSSNIDVIDAKTFEIKTNFVTTRDLVVARQK